MAPQPRKAPINWRPFLITAGVSSLFGVSYTCYDFYTWQRRNKIRGIAPSSKVPSKSQEVLREPCERLIGYDVVVRYNFAEPEVSYEDEGRIDDKDRSKLGRMLRRLYKIYFTEELNDLSNQEGYDPSNDAPQFRTEAIRSVAKPRIPSNSDESLQPSDQPLLFPDGKQSLAWPIGTHLFASMTIEPQVNKGSVGLQSMLDSSTEQTLTKCMSSNKYRKHPNQCVADASTLLSPYLRVMLSTFAFFPFPIPGPLRVCQLGVGGGALPMFLQQQLGSVIGQLDLVDIEPAVLRAAVSKMGLEKLGRNGEMRMCAEDGLMFLEKVVSAQTSGKISSFKPYDVLLVDLFVGSRLPSFLDNPADAMSFGELCKAALTPQGVVAFNMPHRMPEFERVCKDVFGEQRVVALPCSPNSNVVYIATKAYNDRSVVSMNKRHIVRRCRELSLRYQFPFDVSASMPVSWWAW